MDKALGEKKLAGVLKVQCMNGNWNYDPYMHGLANGLIVAQAIITGEKPQFLNAPERWLCDSNKQEDSLKYGRDDYRRVFKA